MSPRPSSPRTSRRRSGALLRSSAGDLGEAVIAPESAPTRRLPRDDAAAGPLPDWLTEEDLGVYVAEFTRTGFSGGLNWYRNIRRNWELTEHLHGAKVLAPAMFLQGDRDPVALFMSADRMAEGVPDLRVRVSLPGAGHWVQQERPGEVNAALLGFLGTLD